MFEGAGTGEDRIVHMNLKKVGKGERVRQEKGMSEDQVGGSSQEGRNSKKMEGGIVGKRFWKNKGGKGRLKCATRSAIRKREKMMEECD